MICGLRACTTRRETRKHSTRTVGLPEQLLENCLSPCGAPTNFGAAPTAMWFYSSTDGDSRLQRLRPVLRVGY